MNGCEKCFGTGALDAGYSKHGVPITKPCTCQIARDLIQNINRAWTGLSQASKIKSSPLSEHTENNLYITATDETLRIHLRHIGLRAHPRWFFKVVTDSDLMTAWLSPASLLGKEILDPEAASVSSEKATLVDLIEPPELMILRLGVKSARNSAMPEVLLETLYHRAHIQKPTWVVDQPTRRLDPSHLAFSDDALHHLRQWEHIALDETRPGLSLTMMGGDDQPQTIPYQDPNASLSLSGAFGSPGTTEHTTTRLERPAPEPKKRKPYGKGRGE